MRRLPLVLVLTFFILALGQTAFSQGFPYHLYAPRTLSELNELNPRVESPNAEGLKKIGISAAPFYSAVRMEYAGRSRKLSKEKFSLFKVWGDALDVQSSDPKRNFLDVIEKEYLFSECNKEYWLTVQTPAANDFPKDMKKGDRLTLYMMVVGGIEIDDKWEYVYLTNSFKIYK